MKAKNLILLFLFFIVCACMDRTTKVLDDTNAQLHLLEGVLSPMIYEYDGNKMIVSYPFDKSNLVIGDSVEWQLNIFQKEVSGDYDVLDMEAVFRMQRGAKKSSGVGIEINFADWDTTNYVFAPAAVYNGNRFRVLPLNYAPYIYNEKDRSLDMPVTITDVPHFNLDGTMAKIEMLTGNCSTPLFGFYNKHKKRGFLMLTMQNSQFGNYGMIIRENPECRTATFILSAPGIRERRYVMCHTVPSEDKAAYIQAGDEIKLPFRIYNFEAQDLMSFFDKFFTIRKDLSGKNIYDNRAPFSYIAKTILAHHDSTKWFENKQYGYICNQPNGNSPFGHLQLGWNGAPVYSLSQLLVTTDERMRRIGRTFDAIEKMQGESGLFYGMFRRGELLGDNFNEMSKKPEIAMIRRTGITIYYGLQVFDLMKKRGVGTMINPSWEAMMHKAADGLVKLWNDYGQFGQHINAKTGEITTNNSTAGAICIGALAYASVYFDEPKYMEAAIEAGHFYYNRDLKNGYVGGGPAEILQCPDSESSAELVESYMALYEIKQDKVWLKMAQDAAAMFSSWVVSYDYDFPDSCDMKRIDAKVTGSVWASIQNEHSAPGIYVMSGDFLFKLYRATGDERYLELGKDIAHNIVQYVTTFDNPIGIGSSPGSVSERVNLSDWENSKNIGMISAGDSNMAWENVVLLSVLQNPGIYIQIDKKKIYTFDHVIATSITKSNARGKLFVKIENPTKEAADISILAETSENAHKPLGWNAYYNWPKIHVGAGETVMIDIDNDGNIEQ